MKLTHLPNETILQITESLSPPDINSLLRASRHLSLLLPSALLSSICHMRSEEYGVKAMYFFAERRDRPPICWLVEKGALEFIDNGGLLHEAVISRSSAVVETLLECGVPVNTKDFVGRSLVYLAVKAERLDVLEVLLKRKDLDVNAQEHRRGRSPFHVAVRRVYLPAMRLLMDDGRVNINLAAHYEETPLHVAARWGQVEVVKMLLEDEKLHVNCLDVSSYTPLHLAVDSGVVSMVQLMLEDERFNVAFGEPMGQTLLHIATKHGYKEIVEVLLDDGRFDPNVPDEMSMSPDDQFIVEEANPEAKGDWTPLHHAVHMRDEAIIELLLADERVDINCRSSTGKTPLHLAVVGKHRGVLELLLDHRDVDAHTIDDDGMTPLELAAELEHETSFLREGVWDLAR